MDELQQGLHRHGPERRGVKLEAGGLALPAPGLVVGVEDAVAQEIPERVAEVLALGIVRELGLEHVLQVSRVCGDDTVKAGEPRAAEDERAALTVDQAGDPLVYVFANAKEEGRQHADHRPHREATNPPLPQGVDGHKYGDGKEELQDLDLRQDPSHIHISSGGSIGAVGEEGGLVAGVHDVDL